MYFPNATCPLSLSRSRRALASAAAESSARRRRPGRRPVSSRPIEGCPGSREKGSAPTSATSASGCSTCSITTQQCVRNRPPPPPPGTSCGGKLCLCLPECVHGFKDHALVLREAVNLGAVLLGVVEADVVVAEADGQQQPQEQCVRDGHG